MFQNWISLIKTQKSNPPSETKLIKPNQNQFLRGNCRKEDPDASAIDDSVSKLKSVRGRSDPMILNDWETAISTQNYNLALPDLNDKGNRYLSFSTATRSYTGSSQDSKRWKIKGTRVIMPTKSKDTKVKAGEVIIGSTKAGSCHDKAKRGEIGRAHV